MTSEESFERLGGPDAPRKTFENARIAIRLHPEYKHRLQRWMKVSALSRR